MRHELGQRHTAVEYSIIINKHRQPLPLLPHARRQLTGGNRRIDRQVAGRNQTLDTMRHKQTDIPARGQIDIAPRKLPAKKRTMFTRLHDGASERRRGHHTQSDAIVPCEFKDDQHGRNGCTQYRRGDRRHANRGISALLTQRQTQSAGCSPENTAQHGTHEYCRAENPTGKSATQGQTDHQQLGHQQGQQQLTVECSLQRLKSGLITNTEYMR